MGYSTHMNPHVLNIGSNALTIIQRSSICSKQFEVLPIPAHCGMTVSFESG